MVTAFTICRYCLANYACGIEQQKKAEKPVKNVNTEMFKLALKYSKKKTPTIKSKQLALHIVLGFNWS